MYISFSLSFQEKKKILEYDAEDAITSKALFISSIKIATTKENIYKII